MEYVKDAAKLAEVTKILALHEASAREFYHSQLSLQVSKENTPLQNLTNIFVVANRARRGTSTGRSWTAFESFSKGVEGIIAKCKGKDPEKAHIEFLKWLCEVKETNQKTANVFLKLVVMFSEDFELDLLDWPTWKSHLHVPLDVWVTRLMGKKYLDVGTEAYNRDFLGSAVPNLTNQPKKYFQLQSELAEVTSLVGQPRIILDLLWWVGYVFCTYWPFLCDNCWINKQCQNYPK